MRKTPMALAIGLVTLFSLVQPVYADSIDIRGIIAKKATEHNIPVAFALGIVKVESNLNPTVRGARGEYGLGQIHCNTAKEYGLKGDCKVLLDPETNLEYSFRYLSDVYEMTNGNMCFAATLYSAGAYVKPTVSSYCKKVIAAMKG